MRDYMSFKVQTYLSQIEDLEKQEKIVEEARESRNRLKQNEADKKAENNRKSTAGRLAISSNLQVSQCDCS